MSLQIAVEKVRWLTAGLLELNGCDADIAQDVAEHMIEAERYGFASHGVTLLPKYLENIARGDVTANARRNTWRVKVIYSVFMPTMALVNTPEKWQSMLLLNKQNAVVFAC